MKSDYLNTYDIFKILAIVAMVVDHIGLFYFDDNTSLRIIGRVAAPIFFFLVGFNSSYRFRLNLFFFGCGISLITFLITGEISLNILLNFVLIRIFLNSIDFKKYEDSTIIFMSILIGMCGLAILPFSLIDYSTFGFIVSLSGLLIKEGRRVGIISLLIGLFFLIAPFIIMYEVNVFHLILLTVVLVTLFTLAFFKNRELQFNLPLATLLKFLSINSLSFYTIHYVLLLFLNQSVVIEMYQG